MLQKIRKISEKGQGMVEYAILLAVVIGIGVVIYNQSGLKQAVKNVFTNATNVVSSAQYQ